MRNLILGVSAISLSACSMGGVGYGTSHGSYEYGQQSGFGYFDSGYEAGVANAGYNAAPYGYPATPCSAPTPMPMPPVQVSPCGQPTFVPPPAPCYQPQPQPRPCGALPMQPFGQAYQQSSQTVNYPSGYPAPQPYPAPMPQGCPTQRCASTYSVSPYGDDFAVNPASPYAYGHNASYDTASYDTASYGHRDYAGPAAPRLRRAPHMYGTLGAVWYDLENPYAGIQGRIGYQSASLFGAEIEGSVGVIGETSPFNQPPLSGEFRDGVNYSGGVFGTARLPLGRNISAHGRVGYHTTKRYSEVEFDNNPDQKVTQTLDGLAYGAGLQMDVTPVDAVRLDYTRYDDDQGGKDSIALAYMRRF